ISDNITRLKVELSGGLAPYQYSGNMDGEELASGEHYLIVVSDVLGCVRALEGITEDCQAQDCAISGAITALQPTCHNQSNGMLSVMATGGTAPYSYRWSNNATTADISGLAAGDYSATITDALDCELVLTATLDNPSAITAVPTGIAPPHPGMSDGAIYVDASGGTGALNFQWLRNSVPFASSEDLSGAPAGDYTLVITDGNGCTATYDFTLTETVGGINVQHEYFTEVFPNPASDKAWLAVSFPKPQSLHLSLWDAAGRALQTWTVKNVTEQNIPLELKNLPNGSYQLRIQTDAGTFKETVVKK
ncbi:MAG: T9SS type A sorting domain-containing protein, partial [Saprospiraceae bacterium]|nr:T9SS type A sorting domain-containing protein [Saprospiraceae bacterium]